GVRVHYGDVLLKHSVGNVGHGLIQIGQKLGAMSGGNSSIVHAAIYVGTIGNDSHAIAESVGSGLRIAPHNTGSHYTWDVWHTSGHQELRTLASEIASNLAQRSDNDHGFGSYSKSKATKSAFVTSNPNKTGRAPGANAFLTGLEGGHHRSYFCSNYVTLAYSTAADILGIGVNAQYRIDLNYEKVSPAEMQKYFQRNHNWRKTGTIAGGGWG
ncbi:MAG: hypothetical protein N2C14_30585, partial [Planctomycetales bacterium]